MTTLIQMLRGRAVLAPDSVTLAVAAAVGTASLVAGLAAWFTLSRA